MLTANGFVNLLIAWVKKHQNGVSIALIAMIGLIAFVPSMKNAGFFGDDNYLLLGGTAFGPQKFVEMYASDRPFLGYTFEGLFRLLGTNIHNYQAFVIFFNFLTSISVFGLVRKLWPQQRLLALATGVLFCIYPGFIDHMHSFNYSVFLLTIFLSMFSIYLTAQAIAAEKWVPRILITLLSMVSLLWGVLNLEYYLGIEALRLAVIFIMIRNRPSGGSIKIAVWKTVINYMPYLLVAAGFFVWRFFFFSSSRGATDLGAFVGALAGSPFYKIVSIVIDWISYVLNVTLFAWFVPVYTELTSLRLKYVLFCAALAIAAGLLVFVLIRMLDKGEGAESVRGKTDRQILLAGLATLIGVGLPIVFVNRQATLGAFSRYTLPAMLGGILLVLGFAFVYLKPRLRSLVLALLVAGGVFVQLGVGKSTGDTWTSVKNIWWQISWRVPSLKPGTVLTGRLAGMPIAEGYDLWGPANLIYDQNPQSSSLPIGAQIVYPDFIKAVLTNQTQDVGNRSFLMSLDPQHLLILSRPTENSCVHVVDSALPDLMMDNSSDIQLLSQYSKITQIDVNAAQAVPPEGIFGPEPVHGWCYYYQKASLALQKGDYTEVVSLGNEIEQKNLSASDTSEWLPFVLSYAETGDYTALDRVVPMYFDARFTKSSFCTNVADKSYPLSEAANDYLENNVCY